MTTVLLSILVLGAAFTLLALRVLLVRDGEFRGTCATNNPYLKDEDGGCNLCGKDSEEPCQRWSLHRWKTVLMGPAKGTSDQ